MTGLPAALDITVTSPLTPAILVESCSTAGVAAANAESRKHDANDPKCVELGWISVASEGDNSRGGRYPSLPARGCGGRCKLLHRGLGLRPRSQRFSRLKNYKNYTK